MLIWHLYMKRQSEQQEYQSQHNNLTMKAKHQLLNCQLGIVTVSYAALTYQVPYFTLCYFGECNKSLFFGHVMVDQPEGVNGF